MQRSDGDEREVAPRLLELRQYLLRQGRRDELIELFDRELVETQEACGMRVVGQFRDVDRAHHFVWLRGFSDPGARAASLSAFYGGRVWQQFGRAANATMIDSDDVLQLRPHPRFGRQLEIVPASRRGRDHDRGVAVLAVAHRRAQQEAVYDDIIIPAFDRLAAAARVTPRGIYETDPAPNEYPALPVRRANCVVWVSSAGAPEALERAAEAFVGARVELAERGAAAGLDEIQVDFRRLLPTSRSTTGASSQ